MLCLMLKYIIFFILLLKMCICCVIMVGVKIQAGAFRKHFLCAYAEKEEYK